MSANSPLVGKFSLGPLLRGEAGVIADWIAHWTAAHTLRQMALIVVGAGAFGAAMGSWRAPEQAAFAAVKLPLILLATAAGNALLNGLLAPLLGLNLRLREAFAAVLMSFALAAVILGAFSPLMAFLVWNLPPLTPDGTENATAHSVMLLTLVAVIAFAGVTDPAAHAAGHREEVALRVCTGSWVEPRRPRRAQRPASPEAGYAESSSDRESRDEPQKRIPLPLAGGART